jgi:probable F420-dependent oxidoreductase
MEGKNPEFGVILALTIRGLAVHSYPEMCRVVRAAEDLGLSSIWLCDHFLTLSPDQYTKSRVERPNENVSPSEGNGETMRKSSIPLLECWTALSALSRETKWLRLGTSVLCNSYRHPAVLAKMAATLDVISEGRLDFGLGAGWFQAEYEAYGFEFPRVGIRVSQLDEALQIIRRMWSDDNPVFKGTYYSINGAICDPPPVQRPHPPIWVGGEGDRMHRIAARLADGVNMRWWSPERFKSRAEYLAQACREFGREPASLRMSATLLVIVGKDSTEVESVRTQFGAIPPEGIVAGSPEQCATRIREYLDAGVNHFLFSIPYVDKSDRLQILGEKVLPALKCS